jgi:hypothetical protein
VRIDDKSALRRRRRVMGALAVGLTTCGLVVAPHAAADWTENLRTAVAAARGSSCELRSDPIVDEAAQGINASTDNWLNHTARAVPETDALPILNDLGFKARKAAILSSATPDEATAIKALLLQGYAKLPDCSYTAYGVSATYNEKKGDILMTVVLAG